MLNPVKSRPSANPTNRFHETAVTYDDGESPPPATVTLIEDHARSIVASNDSPDVGFDYSVNPYRGCLHACAYCLAGDTQITSPTAARAGRRAPPRRRDLRHAVRPRHAAYVTTQVLHHWATRKPAFRIVLADGTERRERRSPVPHRTGLAVRLARQPPFQRPVLLPARASRLLGPGRHAALRPRAYVTERAVASGSATPVATRARSRLIAESPARPSSRTRARGSSRPRGRGPARAARRPD